MDNKGIKALYTLHAASLALGMEPPSSDHVRKITPRQSKSKAIKVICKRCGNKFKHHLPSHARCKKCPDGGRVELL